MNWNNPDWSLFIVGLASLLLGLFDVLSLSLLLPWKNKAIYHTWQTLANMMKNITLKRKCLTGNPYKITIEEGHANFISARSSSDISNTANSVKYNPFASCTASHHTSWSAAAFVFTFVTVLGCVGFLGFFFWLEAKVKCRKTVEVRTPCMNHLPNY